jgi:hypothetical protein
MPITRLDEQSLKKHETLSDFTEQISSIDPRCLEEMNKCLHHLRLLKQREEERTLRVTGKGLQSRNWHLAQIVRSVLRLKSLIEGTWAGETPPKNQL